MSWPLVKLQEITEVIDYGLTASAQKDCDGPLFLRITDLVENGVDWSKVPRCVCDEKKKQKNLLQSGDIVFARTGATTGKSYLIRELAEDTVFASYLIRVRPNRNVCSSYLAHFFKSPNYWHQIGGMSTGATLPGVNATKLSELQLPLPPLEEQKRIAAILDKADAIRQKRKQTIDLANDFLRSVFLDMFGDPVTNPKGWEVKNLGSICQCINGDRSSNYPSGSDLVEDGVLFLSTKNIVNNELDLTHQQFITNEKFKSLGRGKLLPNDMVITLRGTLAQCALFECMHRTGFINAQLMIVRSGTEILPEFLHSLMTSKGFNKELKELGNGAAVPQLTGKQINELNIILPPIDIQEKFLVARKIVRKMVLKQGSVPELFGSLSQKAFSGQL
ncbi:restriction endonuclease subunit S [Vibrio parahaemolyticus]|nr:restriction endonuclease subunit S [Vibrio parahaemolyticus]ELA7519447.1 restriction endonuclease subunit S [Vibrio parahaemolyticus]ELA8150869.1 restriction endonuclease subunit S [Vibrio parahaemolyticus]ELC0681580.1 restriction endonuclease subunit S [Vibrio parahaemolyticus]ELY3378242.1 restriction endonuclease subunit S [Vibrio parahaemolyticus]